jgi:magnesium chelatase subunit D
VTRGVTQSVTPSFPWAAVIGQERLKQALLLCAIDPAIGGVLVRGPRGVAKTTLARAFAELLPGRFVELPLGATEERVAGSLDLGRALGQGEVQFSPGLLARAHDGVLYVDEVNLLPDALVDLLLDAAATGTNVVERDGISHAHAARFVLVGTMNPEEGELRPQLVDRFGLSVEAEGSISPQARTQIVLRRLDFERDPVRFIAAFEAEQRALVERCQAARRSALQLDFTGPGVARAAELCHAAGVEGVRADLAMLRAARAHAAWHEHADIQVADVDAVAELALAHRRRGPRAAGAPSAGGAGGGGAPRSWSGGASPRREGASGDAANTAPASDAGGDAAGDASGRAGASDHGGCSDDAGGGSASTGARAGRAAGNASAPGGDSAERGALRAVPVRASEALRLPEWLASARPERPEHRATTPRQRRKRGPARGAPGAIDWFGTLARHPRPRFADLRRRVRPLADPALWVIALDCSASMLRSGALASAKGAAQALVTRAAQAHAEVVLISFGGRDVRREPTSRQPEQLGADIAALGAGGGTPLRRAVESALELLRSTGARRFGERRLLLFTDGRTRELVHDLAPAFGPIDACVIDCERGPVRLGLCARLARGIGGRLAHIDELVAASPPLPSRSVLVMRGE